MNSSLFIETTYVMENANVAQILKSFDIQVKKSDPNAGQILAKNKEVLKDMRTMLGLVKSNYMKKLNDSGKKAQVIITKPYCYQIPSGGYEISQCVYINDNVDVHIDDQVRDKCEKIMLKHKEMGISENGWNGPPAFAVQYRTE